MHIVVLDAQALAPGDLTFDSFSTFGQLDVYQESRPDEVLSRCADADVVITNKVPFDRARIEALPRLKYIGVSATGHDIIDKEAAAAHGVAVTNVPSYSTDAVAQHVFAFILSLANSVDLHDRSVKEGRWEESTCFCYWERPLFELKGRTLGIVGLGSIGRRVAQIATAFGMEVIYASPHSRLDGREPVSLGGLMEASDIITLHCPLTSDTRAMINRDTLSLVKSGAILVNASRGPLVDEDAVIEALDSGRLAWYCADVLSSEPPRGNKLSKHPRTLITPHIAWAPIETRRRLMGILASNLESYIQGGMQNRIV